VTTPLLNPKNWPLRVKVPLMVAAMMVAVATAITDVVLNRLSEGQEQNLASLAGAYLDGISTAVGPNLQRRDIWETYDALDRARDSYQGLRTRYAIVVLPDNTVLAASDPEAFPVHSPIPETLRQRFASGAELIIDSKSERAWISRTLAQEGIALGRILAEIDIADLLRERGQVLLALVAVNAVLTLALAIAGYMVVRHMVQPVSLLARHVEQIRGGAIQRIDDREIAQHSPEFAGLFRRFNAMADALREREILAQRLADEEKLALLGKLASGMAHEVNNPLGGLMNAVDTLRRHGERADVRETAIGLLDRGLRGIRNVVRAALVTYKGVEQPGHLGAKDVDDLQFLVHHETVRRHLRLDWRNELPADVSADGAAIRQAALNLLLNACVASPIGGVVAFSAEIAGPDLTVTIADQGPGIPEAIRRMMLDSTPVTMPPSGTTGLGVWTAVRLIRRMNGRFEVETAPQGGTNIRILVPLQAGETLNAVA